MTPGAWVILITFSLAPNHGVSLRAIRCPDAVCVALRHAQIQESTAVQRFQVWRAEDFAMLPVGTAYVWPPVVDEQYQ